VLDEGRCGALFPVGDSAALEATVVDLLGNDEERRRLAAAGARRVAAYDWRTVAGDLIDVYASVTAGQSRVREDLRGQIVGRLARRRTAEGEAQ
jgi:phosphatidylinositol alpha-mannosyltransferase